MSKETYKAEEEAVQVIIFPAQKIQNAEGLNHQVALEIIPVAVGGAKEISIVPVRTYKQAADEFTGGIFKEMKFRYAVTMQVPVIISLRIILI